MDYFEKAEAAILKAEERLADGLSAEEWIKIAERWKDLATAKQTSQIPPLVAPRLPNAKQDFRFGQYL